jgi:hypothetical protein
MPLVHTEITLGPIESDHSRLILKEHLGKTTTVGIQRMHPMLDCDPPMLMLRVLETSALLPQMYLNEHFDLQLQVVLSHRPKAH